MTVFTKVDIRIKGKTHGVRVPVNVWQAFERMAKEDKWSIAQAAEIASRGSNGTLSEAIEAYVRQHAKVPLYATREDWTMALVDAMRPEFAKRGCPLPEKIRATIAFTSKGHRGKRRGECWSPDMSADKATEIMVCLRESDPVRIANILTHELVHAAQFLKAKQAGKTLTGGGHGKDFKAIADTMDVTVGKGTHALGDPDGAWGTWAKPLIEAAGPMPHSALAEHVAKQKKQTTRMLKFEHENCAGAPDGISIVWRMSAKGVADKAFVSCPCCGEKVMNPHFEGEDEDGEEMLAPKGHPLRKAEVASVKRGRKFAKQAASAMPTGDFATRSADDDSPGPHLWPQVRRPGNAGPRRPAVR